MRPPSASTNCLSQFKAGSHDAELSRHGSTPVNAACPKNRLKKTRAHGIAVPITAIALGKKVVMDDD